MKNLKKYMNIIKKKIICNFNKSIFFRNLLILTIIIIIGLYIDLNLKRFYYQLYESNKSHYINNIIYNYKWFGIRIAFNTGMAHSLGGDMPIWFIQLLTHAITLPIIISALFLRRTLSVVGLSLISSGSLSNIIDRYEFYYVIDFIFIPWIKDIEFLMGTFNIADIMIVFGSIILFINICIRFLKYK